MYNNLDWWYENSILKVRWETRITLNEAVLNNTTNLSAALFVPYSPTSPPATKWYALMCKMTYTDGLMTPAFKVYDH